MFRHHHSHAAVQRLGYCADAATLAHVQSTYRRFPQGYPLLAPLLHIFLLIWTDLPAQLHTPPSGRRHNCRTVSYNMVRRKSSHVIVHRSGVGTLACSGYATIPACWKRVAPAFSANLVSPQRSSHDRTDLGVDDSVAWDTHTTVCWPLRSASPGLDAVGGLLRSCHTATPHQAGARHHYMYATSGL